MRRPTAPIVCAAQLLVPILATLALPASAATASPGLLLQIALEREGFSPGLLDGRPGPKTALALAEFQRSRGLPSTGKADASTLAALVLPEGGLTTYTITSDDVRKVTGPLPKNWNVKATMKYVGYESLAGLVAERFHCAQGLLAALNPRLSLSRLKVGDELTVPDLPAPRLPRVARLEIRMSQKVIRGYDASGRLVALFHCSIAKEAGKRPTGTASVTSVTNDPVYRFDPAMWPEVKHVSRVLLIQPGPRNPVGLCWIALSRKGYGIHGTPNPELIGKTGSHGCFRLTNWDAQRLGKMVATGATVTFVP